MKTIAERWKELFSDELNAHSPRDISELEDCNLDTVVGEDCERVMVALLQLFPLLADVRIEERAAVKQIAVKQMEVYYYG